jgi:hypothetical protein
MPPAKMMIHDAQGIALGDAATMQEMATLLNETSDTIAGIYADRTGGHHRRVAHSNAGDHVVFGGRGGSGWPGRFHPQQQRDCAREPGPANWCAHVTAHAPSNTSKESRAARQGERANPREEN